MVTALPPTKFERNSSYHNLVQERVIYHNFTCKVAWGAVYAVSRGFFLAWLLAFTTSLVSFVSCCSHAYNFTNAKNHARKKPLLLGQAQSHCQLSSKCKSQPTVGKFFQVTVLKLGPASVSFGYIQVWLITCVKASVCAFRY